MVKSERVQRGPGSEDDACHTHSSRKPGDWRYYLSADEV